MQISFIEKTHNLMHYRVFSYISIFFSLEKKNSGHVNINTHNKMAKWKGGKIQCKTKRMNCRLRKTGCDSCRFIRVNCNKYILSFSVTFLSEHYKNTVFDNFMSFESFLVIYLHISFQNRRINGCIVDYQRLNIGLKHVVLRLREL